MITNGFPSNSSLINNLTTNQAGQGPVDAYQAYLLQTNKSNKSTSASVTLPASGWTGTSAPFSITVAVTGVTTTSNQELLPAAAITLTQLQVLQSANIIGYSQTTNSVTLRAWGQKPTVDIPVVFIVRGDA
jgi:hypothetical protein